MLLEGPDNAGDPSRVPEVVEAAGYFALPLDEPAAVDRWFRAKDVDELSKEEAAVLASRWSMELTDEAVVGDASGLVDVLAAALLDTFRRTARTGEIGAVEVDSEALRSVLPEHEARAVGVWIRTRHGHPSA